MIEIEHLSKRYGEHLAVSDLSVTIESGQIYGFLGPNGAGKSTTMNIMAGCLSATEGHVRIGGYDIFDEPEKAKRLIGYLPEQPPLYLNETPLEYLRFVGEAKGLRGAELTVQIADAVARTGIEPVRNRRISSISWRATARPTSPAPLPSRWKRTTSKRRACPFSIRKPFRRTRTA